MRLALVGDLLLTRELGEYGRHELEQVATYFRECDAAVANLETLFHRYECAPAAESGGSWLCCPPSAASELRAWGIRAVSRANNHAGDWGIEGMELTGETLDAAGIVHAGVGRDIGDAMAPRYLTTATGRLALVSVTTTTPIAAAAGRPAPGVPGRPGVAHVPIRERFGVPAAELAALRRICAGFSIASGQDEAYVGGLRFVSAPDYERGSSCDPKALALLREAVAQGRARADVVLVAVHSHQHRMRLEEPSAALVELCHAAVEAGADIVTGHGPHVLRGVERVGGAVVFYGLGNFVFQPDDNERSTAEARDRSEANGDARRRRSDARLWRSVIALCEVGPTGVSARLVPVRLRREGPVAGRGLPRPADEAVGREILDQVRAASREFGSEILPDGQVA